MEIQRSGIAPTRTEEAAIEASLPPGIYTAVLSGNGSSVGVGLMELYALQ